MSSERKQINHFVVNFNKRTSYGFHALVLNYFVDQVLAKNVDLKATQIYFRLFRTGIIGDILYKQGQKVIKINENFAETQFLAALFESYMFLTRSIYDFLLHFFKQKYKINDNSFHRFINNIRKEKYLEIEGKLRGYLKSSKIFEETRDLRDSIKYKTSNVDVYIKNNKYWVSGTIYKRNGEKEKFDDSLYLKMFGYTTGLFMLMSYLAENLTGVSFKEQIKYQRNKDRGKRKNN